MSIRYLEHATDAFIEVKASSLKEAFVKAGESVVETTLDISSVEDKEKRALKVQGKDLRYLLFNWIEEINYQLITEGFAIRRFDITLHKNEKFEINAVIFGEPLDIKKHRFKVEIKAPTFHLMEILEGKDVVMRYLMDL